MFAELLDRDKPLDAAQAGNYLMVSVRNRCLNLLEHRRVVRQSATLVTADKEVVEDGDDEKPPVDEILDYVSSGLAPKSQQVIEQHFLQQKKYQEIARDMGISRFAVYKHLTRGISQLRAHFAWYQLLLALMLLSGAVFAVLTHLRRSADSWPAVRPPTELPAPAPAVPGTVHYENVELEQILTDIARYNKVELHFLSDAPRHLRLHYDWQQSEPLADIAATLSAFDGITLELRQDALYVK